MRKAYSYIRMSTINQLRGDSLRRQLEASENYARLNNLQLVNEIDGKPLKDIGISAFKGNHIERGVLGNFLLALEEEKIEKGSVLIVESLDRLSRDHALNAMGQFIQILAKDIEIVTLIDNQRYTAEQINKNPSQLYLSLGIMIRANDESATKSQRVKAAWTAKRNNILSKPITAKGPGWLKLNKDKNCFEVIEERAEIVRMIFHKCANEYGLWSIAKYLNENNSPLFGKARYWQISYLVKILKSRAVLGEFQPHKVINGKYVPEGEVVKNYFPPIIEEHEYHLANAAMERRKIHLNGPKGLNFNNLFVGFGYCTKCGQRMVVRSVGTKGNRQLMCSRRVSAGVCRMPHWSYVAVEKLIIKHLLEIDFSKLLGKSTEHDSISAQVISLENKIHEENNKIDRLLVLIMDTTTHINSLDRLKELLNKSEEELESLKEELKVKNKWLKEYEHQLKIGASNDLKQAILLLEKNNEDYQFRASVHELLAKVIERIDFFIDDEDYKPWEIEAGSKEVLAYLESHPRLRKLKLDKLLETKGFKDYYKNFSKRVKITYKTGNTRQIFIGNNTSFTFRSVKVKTPSTEDEKTIR